MYFPLVLIILVTHTTFAFKKFIIVMQMPPFCKVKRSRSSEDATSAGMPTHLICNYISVYNDDNDGDDGDLRRRNVNSL